MATYVLSDVHGYYPQMMSVLDSISPTSDDRIIIAGDIVDRGPNTRRLLRWAMYDAPSNVEFLLGNHEDMLASCIITLRHYDKSLTPFIMTQHPWPYNVRREDDICWLERHYNSSFADDILEWIAALPLFAQTELLGQPCVVVHAGLNPNAWQTNPQRGFVDSLKEYGARRETIEFSGDLSALESQYSQDIIWIRQGWLNDASEAPIHVVSGHTPMSESNFDWVCHVAQQNLPESQFDIAPFSICHMLNKHFIDCGSWQRRYFSKADIGVLRLDDLAAFYGKKASPVYPSDAYLSYLADAHKKSSQT